MKDNLGHIFVFSSHKKEKDIYDNCLPVSPIFFVQNVNFIAKIDKK